MWHWPSGAPAVKDSDGAGAGADSFAGDDVGDDDSAGGGVAAVEQPTRSAAAATESTRNGVYRINYSGSIVESINPPHPYEEWKLGTYEEAPESCLRMRISCSPEGMTSRSPVAVNPQRS